MTMPEHLIALNDKITESHHNFKRKSMVTILRCNESLNTNISTWTFRQTTKSHCQNNNGMKGNFW